MSTSINTSNSIPPDYADLAFQYACGLLSPDQHEAFENLLHAGDPLAIREFESARALADAVLKAVPEIEPDLLTRSNLINALGLTKTPPRFSGEAPPDPFADDARAMVLLRAEGFDWKDMGVPGAKVRNLFVDRERKRATLLIKLDPGTVFPDHDHPDVEECLVLEGDLELGGKVMRRFDYMRIPKGGQHGTPRTTNGCIVLVTCGIAA